MWIYQAVITYLLSHNSNETYSNQMPLPQRDRNGVTLNASLQEIVSGLGLCCKRLSKHPLMIGQKCSSTDSILRELHFLNYRKDGTTVYLSA